MYIFPKNYNFKNKIGGVIDYPTAIFNLLFIFISIFYTPIFLVSIFNHNDDNIICIAYYVIKFLVRPKLYLYK